MDMMSQKATYCQTYYQAYLECVSYIVCGKDTALQNAKVNSGAKVATSAATFTTKQLLQR